MANVTAITALTRTKSLGNVRALTSQARKDSAPNADAAKGLQEQIDKMLSMTSAAVAELAASSPSSSSPSRIQNETLVPGITKTITSAIPSAEGSDLRVYVLAKGETAMIAWDSMFKWAPTEFDSSNDTWTLFKFAGRIDPSGGGLKWFYDGPQSVTGQPS